MDLPLENMPIKVTDAYSYGSYAHGTASYSGLAKKLGISYPKQTMITETAIDITESGVSSHIFKTPICASGKAAVSSGGIVLPLGGSDNAAAYSDAIFLYAEDGLPFRIYLDCIDNKDYLFLDALASSASSKTLWSGNYSDDTVYFFPYISALQISYSPLLDKYTASLSCRITASGTDVANVSAASIEIDCTEETYSSGNTYTLVKNAATTQSSETEM